MNAITKPTKAARANAVSAPEAPAQPMSAAGQLLNIISAASRDSAVDVTKLTALLDLQERVLAKEAKASFDRALGEISAGLPRVQRNGMVELGKDKNGKPTGYKFATWEDMDTILRPRMNRHGFTLSFNTSPREGGGAFIFGTLRHVEGHEHTVQIPLPFDAGAGRNNLQAMGSTLSYGKRYCADMLFNIVRTDEDDDGVRGGQNFIGAEQVAELQDLLTETDSDTAKMLTAMQTGARRLEDVQEKDFAKLKTALQVKKARKIAGKPDALDTLPAADEDRLDALELTLAGDKPAAPVQAEPEKPKHTPEMLQWVRKAELALIDCADFDALRTTTTKLRGGLDRLMQEAPDLAERVNGYVRAATTRINGAAS